MTTSVAVKPPCRVQTTAAITLSGEQTVNGVAIVTGDRVLVKDQADPIDNGIYIADTAAWARAPDFDGSLDAVDGTLVLVHAASGPDQIYELSATNPVIIGTSSLTFALSSLTTTAFGASLIAAADAAAARVLLGFSTFFSTLIAAADAAALRLLLGFSTFFSTLIAAADAAALRTLLGVTAVGDAVFTAVSAAAARTAIGAAVSGANNDITSLTAVTAGGYPALSVTPANLSQKHTLVASVNASGAAVSFTGIPSWANEVTMMCSVLSSTGTDNIYFQLGTSAGFVATGYAAISTTMINGASLVVTTDSVGFSLTTNSGVTAAELYNYSIVFRRLTANTWIAAGDGSRNASAVSYSVSGGITLADALDRVRVSSAGASTFDGGVVAISYQ